MFSYERGEITGVIFSVEMNGKDVPFMRVEWKDMKKDNGKYVIYLGKVLEIKNYN